MILFLSKRFSLSKTSNHRSRVLKTIIFLALSFAVVLLIFSTMTALQDSRFSVIRRVKSFDAVIPGNFVEELKELLPESQIFLYGEGEALLGGRAVLVRYIDDEYKGDIRLLSGNTTGLVLPYLLSWEYNYPGEADLTLLKKGRTNLVLPRSESVPISGLYYTQLGSDFDDTMIFLPLSMADESVKLKTAVLSLNKEGENLLRKNGYQYTLWKEAEKSLYSAFLLEKIMMYVVLLLLFVIIAVSIRQSVRIFFLSKRKEMAELEILGMKKSVVNVSICLSFFYVIIVGILMGIILSLILLPAVSFLSRSNFFITVELKFSWGGLVFYALFMFFVVGLFLLSETNRKKDLMEVIHGL